MTLCEVQELNARSHNLLQCRMLRDVSCFLLMPCLRKLCKNGTRVGFPKMDGRCNESTVSNGNIEQENRHVF